MSADITTYIIKKQTNEMKLTLTRNPRVNTPSKSPPIIKTPLGSKLEPSTKRESTSPTQLTILIDDTDLRPFSVPPHISNDALVPVIDHLLVPQSFVEHPHDDEPIVITGGQLVVCFIPCHHIQGTFCRQREV